MEMDRNLLLCIDPGTTQSGWCLVDAKDYKPLHFGKDDNLEVEEWIMSYSTGMKATGQKPLEVIIEMVDSYGMPVGREVFETCVWIGRFELLAQQCGCVLHRIYRSEEKTTICHSSKANDATIRQALVDRFAPTASNYGKGTKDDPSVFYGFKKDCWAAYAIGVTYLDKRKAGETLLEESLDGRRKRVRSED